MNPPARHPLTPEQFRFVVQHAPLVSLDLVIVDSRQCALLGLRNNEPARNTWFVPGGIIHKGETLDLAFHRIVMAETGLAARLADAEHLGLFEHFYDANRFREPGYGTHYVVNAFACGSIPARTSAPMTSIPPCAG